LCTIVEQQEDVNVENETESPNEAEQQEHSPQIEQDDVLNAAYDLFEGNVPDSSSKTDECKSLNILFYLNSIIDRRM
jgi:hypothetical protein